METQMFVAMTLRFMQAILINRNFGREHVSGVYPAGPRSWLSAAFQKTEAKYWKKFFYILQA